MESMITSPVIRGHLPYKFLVKILLLGILYWGLDSERRASPTAAVETLSTNAAQGRERHRPQGPRDAAQAMGMDSGARLSNGVTGGCEEWRVRKASKRRLEGVNMGLHRKRRTERGGKVIQFFVCWSCLPC